MNSYAGSIDTNSPSAKPPNRSLETMNSDTAPQPEDGTSPCGDTSVSEVVAQYESPLLAYALRMCNGDFSAAQDAVQETFLRLCRTDRSKIKDRMAAWLFRVCRSRVIDMKRTQRTTSFDTNDRSLESNSLSPVAVAEAAEDRAQLEKSIKDLTERQREVLQLRLSAGLSYKEIADITGMTVNNVGVHLHAAVRRLRGTLAME